jgi:hypothetical protein
MAYFQTKNHDLGKFCNERCWKIIWPFGLFYGYVVKFVTILIYFMVIWYISPRFGTLNQEKSGNPAAARFPA